MKRSTLIAVLVTAAVLAAAGSVPRLPLSDAMRSAAATLGTRLTAWPRAARRGAEPPAAVARAAFRPAPSPWRPRPIAMPPTATLAAAALAVLAVALAGAWRLRAHRDRRARVFHMARRGLPAQRIARRARVPQDAVRALLTPGLGARR